MDLIKKPFLLFLLIIISHAGLTATEDYLSEHFLEYCGLSIPKYKVAILIDMFNQTEDEFTSRILAIELEIELNCKKDDLCRKIKNCEENIERFKKEIYTSSNIDHIKALLSSIENAEMHSNIFKDLLIVIDQLKEKYCFRPAPN